MVQCELCGHEPMAARGMASHMRMAHGITMGNGGAEPGGAQTTADPLGIARPSVVPRPRGRPPKAVAAAIAAEVAQPRVLGQHLGLAPGAILAIAPRAFTIQSSLLWQAMLVCQQEFGWPVTDAGVWLDAFILQAMRNAGVELGGYKLLTEENLREVPTAPQLNEIAMNGNGHGQIPEDMMDEEDNQEGDHDDTEPGADGAGTVGVQSAEATAGGGPASVQSTGLQAQPVF